MSKSETYKEIVTEAYDTLEKYITALESKVDELEGKGIFIDNLPTPYDPRIHKARFVDSLTSLKCDSMLAAYYSRDTEEEGKGEWLARTHKSFDLKVGQMQMIIKENDKEIECQ